MSFNGLQLISFDKSQFLQTSTPRVPHFVGWINSNNNITLNTSNSNDHSSNSRMQNSALHTIYFRKFDKYRVDPLVIEHLNAQGKSDPRGGL